MHSVARSTLQREWVPWVQESACPASRPGGKGEASREAVRLSLLETVKLEGDSGARAGILASEDVLHDDHGGSEEVCEQHCSPCAPTQPAMYACIECMHGIQTVACEDCMQRYARAQHEKD